MSKVDYDKVDVLDLIIEVLKEHERVLDNLVERLERLTSEELKKWR